MSKPVCAIDFGTSNSTVGLVTNGTVGMVPLEGAQVAIPSAIFYPANGAEPAYGRTATQRYIERDPGRLMRSLKSILGSSLIDERTGVGGQYRSFEEILVGFVRYLKDRAEQQAGASIDDVVMGRPVHFVDDNDDADTRAQAKLEVIARKAGFKNVLFQYEPIAAALDFEKGLNREELVFIADIGGGTSDFSIVRVGPKRRDRADRAADILATDGVRVGGTNLDTRLSMTMVMPLLGSGSYTRAGRDLPKWPFYDLATWHRIHTITDPKNLSALRQILYDAQDRPALERYMKVIREQTGHLLAKRVEDAKIELSGADTALIDLDEVEEGLQVEAWRDVLEEAVERELEKIQISIDRALKSAEIAAGDITCVFLTGGTSAVPAVRRVLTQPFASARVVDGDLFASVGHGLALDAGRRFRAAA